MKESSPIPGNVFWPAAIIGGGLLILVVFIARDQSTELAIGASLSFVVLGFVSLMVGAGRAEAEPQRQVDIIVADPEEAELPTPAEAIPEPAPEMMTADPGAGDDPAPPDPPSTQPIADEEPLEQSEDAL